MNCRTFFNPCGHLPVSEPVKYAGQGQAIGSVVGGLLVTSFSIAYWAAPDLFKVLSNQAFRGIVYGGGPACMVAGALIGAGVGAIVMQCNKQPRSDAEDSLQLIEDSDDDGYAYDMPRPHRLL